MNLLEELRNVKLEEASITLQRVIRDTFLTFKAVEEFQRLKKEAEETKRRIREEKIRLVSFQIISIQLFRTKRTKGGV